VRRTEDVGVVVKDRLERGWVKLARGDRLSRPRSRSGVVDMHGRVVLCVAVQDVNGVGELGEVAGGVLAVEGRTAGCRDILCCGGYEEDTSSARISRLILSKQATYWMSKYLEDL
jgi:hypothetical protein